MKLLVFLYRTNCQAVVSELTVMDNNMIELLWSFLLEQSIMYLNIYIYIYCWKWLFHRYFFCNIKGNVIYIALIDYLITLNKVNYEGHFCAYCTLFRGIYLTLITIDQQIIAKHNSTIYIPIYVDSYPNFINICMVSVWAWVASLIYYRGK